MNAQPIMHARQLEKVARFLDEHPCFSPLLIGQDALACGFQVGECFLAIDEMEFLIDEATSREAPEVAPPLVASALLARRLL
jgi:hypothetical protein